MEARRRQGRITPTNSKQTVSGQQVERLKSLLHAERPCWSLAEGVHAHGANGAHSSFQLSGCFRCSSSTKTKRLGSSGERAL